MVRAVSAVAFAVVAMNVASGVATPSDYDAELMGRGYMSEIEARQYLADLANVDVRELAYLGARDVQDALVYIRGDKSSLTTTTTHSTYVPKPTPCSREEEKERKKKEKDEKDAQKKKKKEEKEKEKENKKHRHCNIFHRHCRVDSSATTTSTHSTSTHTSSSSPTARPSASSIATATSTSTSPTPTSNSASSGHHGHDYYADNGYGERPYGHPSAYDASRGFDSNGPNHHYTYGEDGTAYSHYRDGGGERSAYPHGQDQDRDGERPYGAYPGAYPHYNNAYASPSPAHSSASSSSTAASAHITPAPTSTHSDLKVSTISTTHKGTVHVTYITTAAQPQCTKANLLDKLKHHHHHHRRELEEGTLFARQYEFDQLD